MYRLKKIFLAALLSAFVVSANAQSDNVVTATYGNATGNTTRTMTIALNHANDYVAFTLNLTLPEGTTVTGVNVKSPLKNGGTVDLSGVGGDANESTDFKVEFNHTSPTKCNVVAFNYGNVAIGGESGEVLFTITLQTTEGVAFDEGSVECQYTFASLLGQSLTGTTETEPRLWGDVVKDKNVDATDFQAVGNIVTKLGNGTTDIDAFAADVDQSGEINATDYQAIGNINSSLKN